MARQRFDTAPEFNIAEDSVVFRQTSGSTSSFIEVLNSGATPVFSINSSGLVSIPSLSTQGGVTSVEISRLSGVTSNVQTQLNAKAPSATPTFTGPVVLPSTTTIGSVSGTEIGYLSGVTSGVQSQINTKAPINSPTLTGTVTLPADTSIGNVSSVEIAYVDGLTSNAQTQINTKAPIASPTFTGTATIPTLSVTGTSTMSGALSFPWSGTNINATGTIRGNGSVVQFAYLSSGPYDLTGGAWVATVPITPKYSNSYIYVWVNYHAYKYNTSSAVNNNYYIQNWSSTAYLRSNNYLVYDSPQYMFQGMVSGVESAGSTSTRTYGFYVQANSSADRLYFYWLTMYAMEIAQ